MIQTPLGRVEKADSDALVVNEVREGRHRELAGLLRRGR
jgi:hypothetical protein